MAVCTYLSPVGVLKLRNAVWRLKVGCTVQLAPLSAGDSRLS